MKVREFISAQVVSAVPTVTVEDVARMISEIDSGATPVIEDDLVTGLITDRDIVIRVIAGRPCGGRRTTIRR
ncbi:CBS domain-containing protein [Rhizobium sp. Root1220]|uniref:CBS domain-containing protein n=1 Tax=Rhizobium sp. Root1220 TaxID=1736432 RepID=UPI0006F5971A|nr:CBS domain-containing protein [Rhizobium sp. Root1220]KQV79619.1 hypothetical protein ASC90_26250 [Rhizobium sp. Root1220]